MSNVIQLQEPYEVARSFSEEQIEIIKNVVARGLTQNEFAMFLYICKRHNLDPIAKQIYAVKRGGQMTIQTGIDGLRLIAERTGKYAPGKSTEFSYDENKNLISATAFVKKFSGGEWHQISATAFLSEYRATTPIWKQMPHVMLEKCAEARALRRAFPSDLSGLYSEEEMEQTNVPPPSFLSEEQIRELNEILEEVDESIYKRMLQFCEVEEMSQIKQSQFETCKKALLHYKEEKTNEMA